MGSGNIQLARVASFQASIPNDVVLIIADDVGIDKIGCYGRGANQTLTPNIDKLYTGWRGHKGVRFDNAIAMAVCSPTRASILTGRWPDLTGVGTALQTPGDAGSYAAACAQWQLASTETCLPHVLHDASYECGQFGKWHLHHPCPDVTGYDFVRDLAGFDHAEGWPFNFNPRASGAGSTETANSYIYNIAVVDTAGVPIEAGIPWIVNGVISSAGSPVAGSLTNVGGATDYYGGGWDSGRIVSETLAWLNTTAQPAFAWVAFHAIHVPIQWPPYAQHTQTQNYPNPYTPNPGVAGTPILQGEFFQTIVDAGYDPAVKPWTYANVQSLDYQVGRILDWLEINNPEAVVIFIGDNGSAATEGSDGWDVEAPFIPDQAKATMYQGGVQVPLIINAPWIDEPGRPFNHPVSCADLFATIVEMAGLEKPASASDSFSLVPALLDATTTHTRCGVMSMFFRPPTDPSTYVSAVFTRLWYSAQCGPMKLIVRVVDDPGEELYDLDADPYEQTDLLAAGVNSLSPHYLAEYSKLSDYITARRDAVIGQ